MDEKRVFLDGIHDITTDEYHGSAGISRSQLIELGVSPFHYYSKYIDDAAPQKESTDALVFGNLVHTMVLEPDKFDEEFIIQPKIDRRTNAGKLAYNQFTGTVAGRLAVTIEQMETANLIAESVNKNDMARKLLKSCKIEKSIYFTDKDTGIQFKVRPDAWNESLVIDLKTTNDASPGGFKKSAYNYGYYLQAGMIKKALESIGIELKTFLFVAVEKQYPYAIGLYVLSNDALEKSVEQFEHLKFIYAHCMKENKWPDFGVNVLEFPAWAKTENNFNGE